MMGEGPRKLVRNCHAIANFQKKFAICWHSMANFVERMTVRYEKLAIDCAVRLISTNNSPPDDTPWRISIAKVIEIRQLATLHG